MTHLRKMMLEELQRRHYSEATTHYYIRHVEHFARYFQCSPDRLGPRHIREYQAQLFSKQKLSPGAVTNHLGVAAGAYVICRMVAQSAGSRGVAESVSLRPIP